MQNKLSNYLAPHEGTRAAAGEPKSHR